MTTTTRRPCRRFSGGTATSARRDRRRPSLPPPQHLRRPRRGRARTWSHFTLCDAPDWMTDAGEKRLSRPSSAPVATAASAVPHGRAYVARGAPRPRRPAAAIVPETADGDGARPDAPVPGSAVLPDRALNGLRPPLESHRRFLNAYYGTVAPHLRRHAEVLSLRPRSRARRAREGETWSTLVEIGPGTGRNLRTPPARPTRRASRRHRALRRDARARARALPVGRAAHGFAESGGARRRSRRRARPRPLLLLPLDGERAGRGPRSGAADARSRRLRRVVDFADMAAMPRRPRAPSEGLDSRVTASRLSRPSSSSSPAPP